MFGCVYSDHVRVALVPPARLLNGVSSQPVTAIPLRISRAHIWAI